MNMSVDDENRRFLVDHARAVWLWIFIADCLKRIKISGCAGGLPAILCFSNVPWKKTLSTDHTSGRYAITSFANLLTQGPLHGMFLLLISKPAFIVGSTLRLVGGFISAEMDSHNILFNVTLLRTSR
jgi:hypothetical protein